MKSEHQEAIQEEIRHINSLMRVLSWSPEQLRKFRHVISILIRIMEE